MICCHLFFIRPSSYVGDELRLVILSISTPLVGVSLQKHIRRQEFRQNTHLGDVRNPGSEIVSITADQELATKQDITVAN